MSCKWKREDMPSKGEKYWAVKIDYGGKDNESWAFPVLLNWGETSRDLMNFYIGNVFRSEEDCDDHGPELMTRIISRYEYQKGDE